MLPFILGVIWQSSNLIRFYFQKKYSGLVVFLIVLDPTLLSQFTLVSPDIPLVFFFLLGWNSIIRNSKYILLISIFFLFLTSMRGMMVAFCLLIIDVFYNLNFKNSFKGVLNSLLKRSLIYLPSLLLFIAFNIHHYYEKGWILYHDNSPWAECFERVDNINGLLFNIGIIGWRIIDFGRIGIWIVFFILFFKYWKKIFKDKQTVSLLLIFICFLLILPSNMIWAKNLLGHRYLIPIYLTFSLFVAKILFSSYTSHKFKILLSSLWFFTIISGNFWVYPDKISQGWDSTLAHLPYYKLREQAIHYLDKQEIAINEVHTFFPNTPTIDDIDLNEDYRNFSNYSKDAGYVLYSNVYNIGDDTYDTLTDKYTLIKEFKNLTVFVRIYKKKV